MIVRVLTALSFIALGSLGWVAASALADSGGSAPPPPTCPNCFPTTTTTPPPTAPTSTYTPPPTSSYTPPATSSYTPPASTGTYTPPKHHKVHHKAKPPHKSKPKPVVVIHPHLAAVHPWQPAPPPAIPVAATKAPTKAASATGDAPTSSYYWLFLAGGGLLIAVATGVAFASSGVRARRAPESRSDHAFNR